MAFFAFLGRSGLIRLFIVIFLPFLLCIWGDIIFILPFFDVLLVFILVGDGIFLFFCCRFLSFFFWLLDCLLVNINVVVKLILWVQIIDSV